MIDVVDRTLMIGDATVCLNLAFEKDCVPKALYLRRITEDRCGKGGPFGRPAFAINDEIGPRR